MKNLFLFTYTIFSTFMYGITFFIFLRGVKAWGIESNLMLAYLSFTIFFVYLLGWYDLFIGNKKGYAHILGASVLALVMFSESFLVWFSQIVNNYFFEKTFTLPHQGEIIYLFCLFLLALPGFKVGNFQLSS